MTGNSLEERLKTHSQAFSGLLSLIPAEYYHGKPEDDENWHKKTSKEGKKAGRKLKFDPNNGDMKSKNAGEIQEERQKNARKVSIPSVEKVKAKIEKGKRNAGQVGEIGENSSAESFPESGVSDSETSESSESENSENSEDLEDLETSETLELESTQTTKTLEPSEPQISSSGLNSDKNSEDFNLSDDIDIIFDDEGNEIIPETRKSMKNSANSANSANSESQTEEDRKRKEHVAQLRSKLQAKIQMLKEKRKAPGTQTPGAPASREEMLQARKRQLELKSLKRKREKEESEFLDDEDTDLSSEISDTEAEPDAEDGERAEVVFSNLQFNDETKADVANGSIRNRNTRKGPTKSDIKSQLAHLEAKKKKLAALDEEKRAKIEEKESWKAALLKAEGEVKVRNDEKLLKKSLRRQQQKKNKSERQWNERIETVEKAKQARIKKREENIAIKKEMKGVKGKKAKKLKAALTQKVKGPKRAGFEGRKSNKNKK